MSEASLPNSHRKGNYNTSYYLLQRVLSDWPVFCGFSVWVAAPSQSALGLLSSYRCERNVEQFGAGDSGLRHSVCPEPGARSA